MFGTKSFWKKSKKIVLSINYILINITYMLMPEENSIPTSQETQNVIGTPN